MIYDGDGNRVAKTVNGVTTKYLVEDDVNPTGFPQVFEETVQRRRSSATYTYGLQRISENQIMNNVVDAELLRVRWIRNCASAHQSRRQP